MKMTNDLSQAVQGVYNSSREIMKNKQRHLYINMLDLLIRTTRASGVSPKVHLSDDYVKFWYCEILPLVFDEEKAIQENAITALETVLPYLESLEFQNLPEWPMIKSIIVDQYSKKLHELRQAGNPNWYKIWCLVVRILDKEILKGASAINTLLSIVELGFRSSDYTIRADAFLCWKVLIEIFAKHNEIFSPKRIKLICIPLKSSPSKTLETSLNKLKVWWYFLCKLAPNIDNYLEIYESFLVYCFGSSCKQSNSVIGSPSPSTSGQGRMYSKVQQMAIVCMIESLGRASKEVSNVLNSMGLERLCSPLITKSLMEKCGKQIIAACVESTLMASDQEGKFGKQIETLWKMLHDRIVESKDSHLYYECIKQLTAITDNENFATNNVLRQLFVKIIDELTKSKEIPHENERNVNTSKLSECLILLLTAVNKSRQRILNESMENIAEICSLKSLVTTQKYWMAQKNIIVFIMGSESTNLELSLHLWRRISATLTQYIKQNLFEFKISENAKIVNEWIVSPIQSKLLANFNLNNAEIFAVWKNLIDAAYCSGGQTSLTTQVLLVLHKMLDTGSPKFVNVLGSFLLVLDASFDSTTKPVSVLELVNQVLSNSQKPGNGHLTYIVQSLTTYLSKLQENQIILAFPEFKTICATVIEKENTGAYTKQSADNFKKVLQDKLKTTKAKEKKLLKEIKDLMNRNSNFVIIPTVWSMNPEKLTEHQKEKMKEKRNDIPALYNDISQSQDSSIKPWTPKKIVIAKSKDSLGEIVLENNVEERRSPSPEPVVVSDVDLSSAQTTDIVQNVDNAESNNPADVADLEPTDSEKIKSNVHEAEENNDNEKSSKKANKHKTGVPDKILKKLNIKVEGQKSKTLLRELKTIEIDTVEGNTVLKGRFRERRSVGGKDDNKSNKKRNSGEQTTVVKRKRSDNNEDGTQNTEKKKKDSKVPRKSLNFESGKESADDRNEDGNKNENGVGESNESTDEVIEASQTSESVLAKKASLRKSIGSTTNNNTLLKSINKPATVEHATLQPPQSTSLSPQKENSSPNVDETIPETQTSQNETTPTSDAAIRSPQKSKNSKISEMDTEPLNTDSFNNSLNAEFLKPMDVSPSTTPRDTYTKLVQSVVAMRTPAPPTPKDSIADTVPIKDQDTQPNTEVPVEVTTVGENLQSDMLPNCEKANLSISELNCSIRSSPERRDADERNSEFLNSTLNISPILNGEHKDVDAARTNVGTEKPPSSPTGRKSIRVGLQLPISPPERKSTNNSESPPTRPKHLPTFTGRGAQLINMIRNRRAENTPKTQTAPLMSAKTDEKPTNEQANIDQQSNQTVAPQTTSPPKKDPTDNDQQTSASGPALQPQQVSLLVFSKVLPSPYASPSASILKRKIRYDSFDESDSPASKRKRVSFHDPPVSLTKEYVKFSEEDNARSNANRCLLPDRTSTPNNISLKNNSFKRKSRADSMLELANFADNGEQSNGTNSSHGQTTAEMESLKWNNATNDNPQPELDERCLTPSPSLCFTNEEALLKHVMEKYQLETIFEKYTENDRAVTNKSVRSITNRLCTLMKEDSKTKSNVLEILSEQHPREFLDHAIQENLSYNVCERLNYNSIVEFVCEKSKLNEDCRRTLLERMQSLLNVEKLTADAQNLMMGLLKNHRMSDQDIVACMKLIVDRQQENMRENCSSQA